MKKVKLTREQANEIEKRKTNFTNVQTVKKHIEGWEFIKCLNKLSTDEMIRSLYIGYEVEPTYTKGDWVITEGGTVGEVYMNSDVRTTVHLDVYQEQSDGMVTVARAVKTDDILRHATPKEVAEEKERRMDKKLDGLLLDLNNDEKARLQKILSNEKKKPNF